LHDCSLICRTLYTVLTATAAGLDVAMLRSLCVFDQLLMHTVCLKSTKSWLQRSRNIKFLLISGQKMQTTAAVLQRQSLRRNRIEYQRNVTCRWRRYWLLKIYVRTAYDDDADDLRISVIS